MAMEDATRIKYSTEGLVLRSIDSGAEHPLHGEMLVGREIECAITLDSTQASRYHAKINVSAHGVYIEDLHSTNGTYVNGKRSRGRLRLSVGDEITFDTLAFRLTSTQSGDEEVTVLSAPKLATQTAKRAPPPRPIRSKEPPEELQEVQKAQEKPGRVAVAAKPSVISNPEWVPPSIEDDSEDDSNHTQMISATHMHRMVERNKNDININVGSGPRLIVMTAPLRGKLFSLEEVDEGTRWQVGRGDSCNIQLNDKTISIDHARLSLTSSGFTINATHAKNGVIINGKLQNQALLKHNDKIQIGRTELLFRTDDAPEQSQLPETAPYEELKNHRFTLISTLAIVISVIIAIVLTSK